MYPNPVIFMPYHLRHAEKRLQEMQAIRFEKGDWWEFKTDLVRPARKSRFQSLARSAADWILQLRLAFSRQETRSALCCTGNI